MKALVLRLLLLLLPLQFLWAGAALACQHEPSPTALHVGHHAVAKSQVESGGDTKPPSGGSDCSVCHFGSSALADADAVTFSVGTSEAPALATTLRLATRWPDRPERPNWHPPS